MPWGAWTPTKLRHSVRVLDSSMNTVEVETDSGRGYLKALVYMSGEAAVIASPRGQMGELIWDGENGFLAGSPDEWLAKLERLITDQALRQKLAVAGLTTARNEYSLEKSFDGLLQALAL